MHSFLTWGSSKRRNSRAAPSASEDSQQIYTAFAAAEHEGRKNGCKDVTGGKSDWLENCLLSPQNSSKPSSQPELKQFFQIFSSLNCPILEIVNHFGGTLSFVYQFASLSIYPDSLSVDVESVQNFLLSRVLLGVRQFCLSHIQGMCRGQSTILRFYFYEI